jgi:hypothetical protein
MVRYRRRESGVAGANERLRVRPPEVPKTAPVIPLAAYYSTVLHGIALQSRDGASRETLTQVVEFSMAGWQQVVNEARPPGALDGK